MKLMYYDTQGEVQNPVSNIGIEDYAPLVKRIAHHLMARMPACVQVEDLIQAGMIGLIEAAQKYDASKGASFETYAGIRIRGAIIDDVRKGDWVPRSVHRNARRIAEVINTIEHRTGSDASDQAIASELGVNLDEYHRMAQDAMSSRLFSYEEATDDELGSGDISGPDDGFFNPFEGLQRDSLKQSLAQAITQLSERERLVLSLYYNEELNLKEIGEVLGVSESRVSQIHSQAALRLRARLADWKTGD